MTAAVALALYSGCGDQSSERRGGGDIPNLSAGSGMTGTPLAGASGDANDAAGAGGAWVGELVPWCGAYKIINCVCQQCHQDPPLHNAPIPLMTYADTQAPFPKATSTGTVGTVWQEMQKVISSRLMPFMGDATVMPPVKPLSDEQQATMLAWLAQGALPSGGTDCPQTCDWTKGAPPGDP